ncbi:unnamed protein product [Lupinus luteus]|uniref:Uncharacterized protein n=1 Tax=Lupinus luteus TaxID=3873 RepID=A0AAV1XIK7_LUPLU
MGKVNDVSRDGCWDLSLCYTPISMNMQNLIVAQHIPIFTSMLVKCDLDMWLCHKFLIGERLSTVSGGYFILGSKIFAWLGEKVKMENIDDTVMVSLVVLLLIFALHGV